jgi:hypothetical protein
MCILYVGKTHLLPSKTGCLGAIILAEFAKLREVTIGIVMSLRPSVCPSVRLSDRMELLDSHWEDFSLNSILKDF